MAPSTTGILDMPKKKVAPLSEKKKWKYNKMICDEPHGYTLYDAMSWVLLAIIINILLSLFMN